MMSAQLTTLLSLVLAYAMWSTGFILVKVVTTWLPPLTLMTLRMLPPLVIYLLLWKHVQPQRWHREDFKWLALMVLGDPLGTLFFQSHALPLTTASQSGMIFACLPLLMAAAARILFKEAIKKRCLMGIICAFTGVLLVALTGGSTAQAPNPILGNSLSFLAICSLLTYSLTVKRLAGRYKPYTLLFVQAIGASCVQIPLFLLFPPSMEALSATPWSIYLGILYMGLFPACIGYFLVNRALSLIKAAHVGLLNTLVPVFVLVLGHLVLGERLILMQYAGCFMVLTGAVLAGLPESSERA